MPKRRIAMPYKEALHWILDNDDIDWLDADGVAVADAPSVTACLVADIYGRDQEEVRQDLLRMRENDAKK